MQIPVGEIMSNGDYFFTVMGIEATDGYFSWSSLSTMRLLAR